MSDRSVLINSILGYGKSGTTEDFYKLQHDISPHISLPPKEQRVQQPPPSKKDIIEKQSYQSLMTDIFAVDLETIRCNGGFTGTAQEIESLRACLCSDISDISQFRS